MFKTRLKKIPHEQLAYLFVINKMQVLFWKKNPTKTIITFVCSLVGGKNCLFCVTFYHVTARFEVLLDILQTNCRLLTIRMYLARLGCNGPQDTQQNNQRRHCVEFSTGEGGGGCFLGHSSTAYHHQVGF